MNLPIPEYGDNDKQTMDNLMDTVMKLRKELEYTMYHLDDDNIPDLAKMKGDIDGNHTMIIQTNNDITLLAADVAGNKSQIQVQAGQISSLVTDVSGNTSAIIQNSNQIQSLVTKTDGHASSITQQAGQIQSLVTKTDGHASSITQLSDSISLKVGYGNIVSAINMSPELISINADKINLNGVVTMQSLARVYGELIVGSGMDSWGFIRLAGNEGNVQFTNNRGYLQVSAKAVSFDCDVSANLLGYVEAGQYVKKIGASSDRLFVVFADNSVHEIKFTG